MKTDRREEGYRIALKRIIRAAVGAVDNEASTEKLEDHVKAIARTAPAIVARGVEAWFEEGAKAWERGNNSGNNWTLRLEERNCDMLRNRAERILKLWDVRADYPGLYPSFTWNGQTYHTAESLMRDIAHLENLTVWRSDHEAQKAAKEERP